MNWQHAAAGTKRDEAMKHYNSRFNNTLYQKATHGKGIIYANALGAEAMALCGSPFYAISRRKWSKAAILFLALFV